MVMTDLNCFLDCYNIKVIVSHQPLRLDAKNNNN